MKCKAPLGESGLPDGVFDEDTTVFILNSIEKRTGKRET